MGNITKIEDKIALSSGQSNPESVNPAQQSTSELIEWICIPDNDATPFIRGYDIAAFCENRKIYFFDGKTGGNDLSSSKLFVYDVGTKQFEIFSVEGRFKKLSWLQKIGDTVYSIIDGYLNIYDIESKKTTNNRQPLPTIARNVFHDNQSIYIFNFRTTGFQLLIYDTKQGTWRTEKFRWPSSMHRHPAPAITFVENVLYAFAGSFEANSYSNKLYKFDFENKEWTLLETKGDTPIGVSGHALASLNIQGVPHLISLWGYNGQYQNVLQILNLKTLVWEVTQLPHKRTMTSLVSVDNVLHALGGCSRDDSNHFEFYNDIHVIKPKDWSLKGLCLNVIRTHIDKYEDSLLNQLPSDVKDLI